MEIVFIIILLLMGAWLLYVTMLLKAQIKASKDIEQAVYRLIDITKSNK